MKRFRVPFVKRCRGERGTTLLEFAFGSALLFSMIFGIIELGWAVWQYNMVSNLAQEGARWAMVHGSLGSAPTPATTTDVSNYVLTRSGGMVVTTDTTWTPNKDAGSTVTVIVSIPHTSFTSFITSSAITLSSTASMIIAR